MEINKFDVFQIRRPFYFPKTTGVLKVEAQCEGLKTKAQV